MDVKTPIDSKVTIAVSADKMNAFATLTPPQNGGNPVTADGLNAAIRAAGVVYGISADSIKWLTGEEPPYNRQEVIASAQKPTRGDDAVIEYHFATEKELKPREREDGSVDYKDLGLVSNVNAGGLLCTKKPATSGMPGKNVLGAELPGISGKDVPLPIGAGTKASDDGLALYAAVDGNIAVVNKRVTVSNLLTIEQNVGVETGNIDFIGSVKVNGNVMIGYKVKASGSVTVHGMLDGGSVEADGSIIVDNGFNGISSGEIISGGDLSCKYLQNGKVSAKGNIYTSLIIGCTVRSGDTLTVAGAKSQIYNSSLSARNTIKCVNAGTSGQSKPVVLEVGSDPELIQRKMNNPKEAAEAEKKLRSLEMIYNIFADREKRGQLTVDKIIEYEAVKNTMNVLKSNLAELQSEWEEIEESMKTSGFGTVIVEGVITEGSHIVIGSARYVLPSIHKYIRFTKTPQGIVTTPAK